MFPRRSGISGHPGSGAGAHGRWDSALLHSRALGSCCAKTCQGTRHVSCQRVANSCWPQCATHLRRLAHRTSSTHPLSCVRRDREVVLAAVKKRGSALQYASAGLRADREVVMTALRTGPGRKYRDNFCQVYFQYASPTLRADIDFVRPAVLLYGAYAALQHVSAELQVDTRLDFLRRQWRLHPSSREWDHPAVKVYGTCLVQKRRAPAASRRA